MRVQGLAPTYPSTRFRLGLWLTVLLLLLGGIGGVWAIARYTDWLTRARGQAQTIAQGQLPGWMLQKGQPDNGAVPAIAVEDPNKALRDELARIRADFERERKAREALEAAMRQKPPAPAPATREPRARKRAPGIFVTHDPGPVGPSAPEYVLAAGATVIPIQIYTAMNSDVGTSHFTAKVTRPVFDTKTGQHQLISQNDTILGKDTGANLTFLSERLPTFSLKLTRADGTEVDLGESPVTDQQGVNGLSSGVNHHWFQKYASALILGVLRAGQVIVQTEVAQEAGVVLTSPSRVSERVLGPAIDARSTVWVNAGELGNVLLLKALQLPAVN